MALIVGSSGDDTLIGTPGSDTLVSNGGSDLLRGRGGDDTYDLFFDGYLAGTGPVYVINETNGGNSAGDRIVATASLIQFNATNVFDYAGFKRVGLSGQTLVIDTASRQNSWSSAGIESGTIKIVNQYDAARPGAQVEILTAGGIDYNLLSSSTGTAFRDILTGWKTADILSGGGGDDYVSGGGQGDLIHGDDGNDVLFGEGGRDIVHGDGGIDRIFGGSGRDKLFGGLGNDMALGGAGKDIVRGGDGDDTLDGGAGNDRLFGGDGGDRLIGAQGDDILTGNKGGDIYMISSLGSGSDTIIDRGNAAGTVGGWYSWNQDEVELSGYTSLDQAIHSIDLQISGNDLVLSYWNPSTPGSGGQITVQDHFLGTKFALEQIDFGNFGFTAIFHIAHLAGDNYTYSVHGGNDVGGNDVVLGTTGGEEIYGGIGSDLMLGGGGSDSFMFHDEGDNRGGTDLILDFDPIDDVLDFTDIHGFGFGGLTITQSLHGHALITSVYGAIELAGISAASVDASYFAFA